MTADDPREAQARVLERLTKQITFNGVEIASLRGGIDALRGQSDEIAQAFRAGWHARTKIGSFHGVSRYHQEGYLEAALAQFSPETRVPQEKK